MSILRFTTRIAFIGLACVSFCATANAQCPGEAPAGSPCAPRVVAGQRGTHTVVMDVTNAIGGFQMACGFNVGRAVWFEVTPDVSGQLTFTTCHPSTSFDTVIQPWKSSGDCEFPVRLDDLCVDDSETATCDNGCQAFGGNVSFAVVAGETYLFEVGSYNDNAAQCALCLGINVTLCGADPTPPVAMLASPASFSCGCDVVQIVGTAMDSDDGLRNYTLEYRPASGGPWTFIADSTTQAVNAVLADWNTTSMAQGYYFLRLTAKNGCGQVDTDTQVVWLDGSFDTLTLGSPAPNGVYAGLICFDGTASDNLCFDRYTLGYRPTGGGAYSPIDGGVFNTSVINNPLGTWDSTSAPDGRYEVKLTGLTACGNSAELVHNVVVDNTPPTVFINAPLSCDYVDGVVQIVGTALDANIAAWTLQVAGGNLDGWRTLNSGTSSVTNAVLANWDTSSLPACAYVLRLIASDSAVRNCTTTRQRTEHYVTVNVGSCGDFDVDDDGDVDLFDFSAFQGEFVGPLP